MVEKRTKEKTNSTTNQKNNLHETTTSLPHTPPSFLRIFISYAAVIAGAGRYVIVEETLFYVSFFFSGNREHIY